MHILNVTNSVSRSSKCPRLHRGSLQRSPDPLAGFKGRTLRGLLLRALLIRRGRGREGRGAKMIYSPGARNPRTATGYHWGRRHLRLATHWDLLVTRKRTITYRPSRFAVSSWMVANDSSFIILHPQTVSKLTEGSTISFVLRDINQHFHDYSAVWKKRCQFIFDYNYGRTDFGNFSTTRNRNEYSTKRVQTASLQPDYISTLPGKK